MKRIYTAVLMLLIAYSSAIAGDYFRLDVDSVVTETVNQEFPFIAERTCPDPTLIMGHSNGWVITASGAATWSFNSDEWSPTVMTSWFNLGGGMFTNRLDDISPDSFLTGGASVPPGGMPVFTETNFFSIFLDIGPGEGEICFDSAYIPPAGAWKWSGLACGLGGAPDRPQFIARDSSDADHPVCVVVYEQPCIPPAINVTPVGNQLSGSHCDGLSFAFAADPGMDGPDPATIVGWSVVSGIGNTDNYGNYSVTPQPTGTYPVTIEVTNSCGESDSYSFDLHFTNSDPYFTNCPDNCAANLKPVYIGPPTTVALLSAIDPDPCQSLTYCISSLVSSGLFYGTVHITGNALVVTPSIMDASLELCITVTAEDDQGGTAQCEVGVQILWGMMEVQIDKLERVYQGTYATVGINLNASTEYFGGFDFLVSYDPTALTFMNAAPGSFIQGCWEYFTYRNSWLGNCGDPCGSGNARVVAMADLNNGAHHPDPACLRFPGGPDPVQLVKLTFYVTNDYTYQCMYVPIRFEWFDCGDNAISSVRGDTLWISRKVYDIEFNEVTGEPHYGGHWWIGDCQNPDPTKPSAIPFVDYIHGGIDIACADSIDRRGDLNLNDIPNEIADAVLYTSYFIYGLSVFNINLHGQIAASDVNNDGRVLTIGDLVYLVRIITGDELGYPRLSPFAADVELKYGDVISTRSAVDIGAALFVFDIDGDVGTPELLVDGMKLRSEVVDGRLRVLVWSSSKNRIAAGECDLLSISGDLTPVEASISDYYGNLMTVRTAEKIVPAGFALMQNYPNPFNSATEITIVLPEPSQYSLKIYNVAGRLVESFEGYGSDQVTVTWDASSAASGVYFYKATAGTYTDTRKMVLMK